MFTSVRNLNLNIISELWNVRQLFKSVIKSTVTAVCPYWTHACTQRLCQWLAVSNCYRRWRPLDDTITHISGPLGSAT